MGPRFNALTVSNFRALRQFSVEGLGRVNLLTGRNNTGKSSVLEAIRILASEGAPSVMQGILQSREEFPPESDDSSLIDSESVFWMSSLFHGFPPFSDQLDPIFISARGPDVTKQLRIGAVWMAEHRNTDGRRMFVRATQGEAPESIPSVSFDMGTHGRTIALAGMWRRGLRSRSPWGDSAEQANSPCVYVGPYGGEKTATLGALWDKIALSDEEKDVVEAMRIVEPEISAISMVGGSGQQRTAIVRTSRLPRPVPLRSFGDGMNRLFGIILSLVTARGGLLLIDEFENGMHHTVQLDAWRVIFKLSRKLGIQVFATSHSWDSIEAFQRAAAEDPDEGVLVRLTRRGDDVIPTVFSEQELAVATREKIEVR